MRISWQQLHRLPVSTQSGQSLGVVAGVEIDVDSQAVSHYEIMPGGRFLGRFAKNLLVAPSEVVAITRKKMVVKDTVIPLGAKNESAVRLVAEIP